VDFADFLSTSFLHTAAQWMEWERRVAAVIQCINNINIVSVGIAPPHSPSYRYHIHDVDFADFFRPHFFILQLHRLSGRDVRLRKYNVLIISILY
jgi:hypothetical protein